jgi:hypothetical protein
MAIVQRRSKPVNGSVVAFVAGVVAVGVVLVVAGAVVLVVAGAVVLFGALLSFDGNAPVEGVGVVAAGVVAAGVVGVVGVWP